MGIVFRQSVKSTLSIFFGAFLGAITTYLYTFVLTPGQLGFHTIITHAGAVAQLFVMMGSGSLLMYFIQKYNDERRKVLISFSFLVTCVTAVLATVVYTIFRTHVIDIFHTAEDRSHVSDFYYWLPVLVLIWGFMSLFDSYLLSQLKVAVSVFTREVLLRVVNVIILALFFFHVIDFEQFIVGTVLAYVVPMLILFFLARRTTGFGFSTNWRLFSMSEYLEIVHFAWYHLLLGASLLILGFIDTLMLGALDKNGMQTVAPYRIAIFIVTLMTMPYRAMASSAYAILNQAYIDDDTPKMKDLFSRSALNIFIVATGMFVIIACNLDNVVAILPPGYEVVKPVLLILMLGRWIDMSFGLSNELISISRFYKFSFRLSALLLIMVIAFNWLLIPQYSIYGAAWSATLALAIFNILKMGFLWYKMDIQPFSRKTVLIVAAAAVSFLAGYFFPYVLNAVVDTIIRTAIILVTYTILLIWLKPSDDLNTYLRSVKEHKRLF